MKQSETLTGEKLIEAREILKISRKEMSARLRIDYRTLWSYERGKTTIPAWVEPAVCNLLKDAPGEIQIKSAKFILGLIKGECL